ncbi:GNAT family N-acetyltransferase [Aristaeella lactis]|uniref:Phosphinothricin acetyltransferase n=1 Tax=Aristaeella lactis TaxID=3046383 RepID=A0AC61PP68_9FIRM|nr:GNAT family N-acetyltransferase [Aristaeella lactis]QUA53256.1 N-acetyltransferase [Aristaeella lactis]SMC81252.1 phosphinothricin acetyltransferase [Aristaeella lactis]
MDNGLIIRDVQEEDAERLAEIYAYYVRNTAVSFEYTAPSVSEFRERICKIKAKYPYLVCERQGKVIGYAYAGRYSPREAYQWTATTSIYIDHECRRQGAGSLLYRELEGRLRDQGIVNLLAGVGYCEKEDEYLSHDSYKYHLKEGYTLVAQMKGVGKKFDRWYDLLWLQKKL